jgi:hypothetical protein
MSSKKALLILLLQGFAIFSSIAWSADVEHRQCMDVLKAMKFAFQGVKESNLVYSLKRGGETYYMLYVSAYDENKITEDGVAIMPWRLLERQGESTNYCLIGAGKKVERLLDMHDAPGAKKKYGMPGSGYQRCTDSSDGIFSSLAIRVWANKELGKSYVQHFTSEIGQNDFALLNSTEGQGGKISWIMLNSKKGDPSSVCYYDRGDDMALHPNFKIPPRMSFEVPKIQGIEQ